MKKILLILIISGLGLQNTFAQEQKYDWKTMKPDERKAIIQKMSPQERMSLLKQFRQNMVVSQLDVPQNDQEEFKKLYNEYQEKQNEIKSKFKPNEDYENMSDEEAKQQLNQSFEVGQQLLDNRKAYSQKFMKVIKPQQVLQMYQTEGRMRNKILDRKEDGPQRSQSRRP
ncbi:MAG TPA: hypothetical protein PKC37_09350 [Kaistella sp.]|jgi:hypothetical protein|uniref:hypothetical protein n=1 Tax=Candidatus Kaistella beijingensis TaxID=2820270 RepID=UPI001CC56384|nr:hypothetical protein [Candidatus Kaistella beijingensis]UBB88985.1 hypothetical protein J4771_08875 [Candidatus Kaistella beijingensis]HMU08105.1 hypothetical protein [Kaistella sp.]